MSVSKSSNSGKVERSSSVVNQFVPSDFINLVTLGVGGQARVDRGYNENLGHVALKVYLNKKSRDSLKEVQMLLKHSKHKNIIQLIGVLMEKKTCIGYVMEYMEIGSLSKIIHDSLVHYQNKQVYYWIEQIGKGIEYLHNEGLIHRDINPKNILLGKNFNELKIADFGTARSLHSSDVNSSVGTYYYMAPEIFKKKKYGCPADIYSFSITIWEILYRKFPYEQFEKSKISDLIRAVLAGQRPFIDDSEQTDIMNLLTRGWSSDAKKRPTVKEIVDFAKSKRTEMKRLGSIRRLASRLNSIRESKRLKKKIVPVTDEVQNTMNAIGDSYYEKITIKRPSIRITNPYRAHLEEQGVSSVPYSPFSSWERRSSRARSSFRRPIYHIQMPSQNEENSPRRLSRLHTFFMG